LILPQRAGDEKVPNPNQSLLLAKQPTFVRYAHAMLTRPLPYQQQQLLPQTTVSSRLVTEIVQRDLFLCRCSDPSLKRPTSPPPRRRRRRRRASDAMRRDPQPLRPAVPGPFPVRRESDQASATSSFVGCGNVTLGPIRSYDTLLQCPIYQKVPRLTLDPTTVVIVVVGASLSHRRRIRSSALADQRATDNT